MAGISKEQMEEHYNRLLIEQNNRCAICKEEGKALSLDHDYSCCPGTESCGRCLRGLLCNDCHLMLEYANYDPEILTKWAEFIEKHRG